MANKTVTSLPRFQKLFRGRENAYGQWQNGGDTKRGEIPEKAWLSHLAGKGPILGVVPIQVDNTCYWGAIDFDDDDVDHAALAGIIAHAKLPLITIRSKSGAAHLYVFLKDPVSAKIMIAKLKSFAKHLNLLKNPNGSMVETFPKQAQLKPENVGNWINLPYYGTNETTRKVVLADGRELSFEEFLDYAEANSLSSTAFEAVEPGGGGVFESGPPCLQALDEVGYPENSRNMGLYNVAIFFKLAQPENWQDVVRQYNTSGKVDPPLKPREIDAIIRSVEEHDYQYKCDDMPVAPHCKKTICGKQKHGIGAFRRNKITARMPQLGDLRKITTDPPRWLLRVDEEDVDLQTDDLMLVPRFRRAVLEKCNRIFPIMKQPDWDDIVSNLLGQMTTIEAPEDSGTGGQFRSLFMDFLMRRKQAESREDILAGLPIEDGKRVYFRGQDLMDWLERKKFRDYDKGRVYTVLRNSYAVGHDKISIKGGQQRVWYVLTPENEQSEDFTPLTPKTPKF